MSSILHVQVSHVSSTFQMQNVRDQIERQSGIQGKWCRPCSYFLSTPSLGGTKRDMDIEVIIITSCLRIAVDFWERTNISQHSCQVLCTCTIALIIFSVVMSDNYCQIPLPVTFGFTTSPSEILCSIFKLCQVCRKPQPCWQSVFKPQHN